MWRILVSSLLVAVAVGQQNSYSDPLDIADGYLPPQPRATYGRPKIVRCEDPKTYTTTVTRKIPKVVRSTVVVKVPQIIKSISVIEKVVPSVKVVRRVKEVRSPVVKINTVSKIVNKVVKSVINVPGKVIVMKTTELKDQISVKTDTYVATGVKSVVSTDYREVTDVKRVVKTVSVPVPEVSYVRKTELVPGSTTTTTSIKYVQVTDVKKYQPPAKTEIKKEIKLRTSIEYRDVPGPRSTTVITDISSVYIGSTSISKVPQIRSTIIPVSKKVVKTVVKTVMVTAPVTSYSTIYETMPVYHTVSKQQVHTVPLQVVKTEIVVKSVRRPDVVRSVVVTDKKFKTVPDPDSTITSYRNVESTSTVISRSTIIKPVRVTKVVEKTEPCSSAGYSYDAPRNPLVF